MNTQFAVSLYGLAPGTNGQGANSTDKERDDLEAAARQFEALFIRDMLKSMRSAGMGEALGESEQTKLFREMHDKQLATSLAESGSIGIAELVVQQLRGPDRSEPGNLYSPPGGTGNSQGFPLSRPSTSLTLDARPGPPIVSPPAIPAAKADALETRRINDVGEPARFENPTQFIQALWSHAKEAGAELGLSPDVLLAQAALETGWGRHFPRDQQGQHSNNLFGIKAGRSWDGPRVVVRTLEFDEGVAQPTHATFRAYGDFRESFQDYVELLRGSARYAGALERVSDPPRFLESLQLAGYATDPKYASKIEGILGGETMRGALEMLKF